MSFYVITTSAILISNNNNFVWIFQIKAQNYQKPGLKTIANVRIKVKDINDHPPVIDEILPIHISPITERGTVVARLTANDFDRDPRNNKFMFVLQNDSSFKFSVHPFTGK